MWHWNAWRTRVTSCTVVTALSVSAFLATVVPGNASVQAATASRLTGALPAGTYIDNGVAFSPPLKPNYTPVDPTQLQPNIPAVYTAGTTPDPNGDLNLKNEILASIHPTNLAALDAKVAPTTGALAIKPGDQPDVIRMKKNGGWPVIVSLPSELTPSSLGGVPTEYTVWYKEPGCVQPPVGFDPGKATPEQRNLYGFPPLHPHDNVAAYDARVSWMKTRVCEYRFGNSRNGALFSQGEQQTQQSTTLLKASESSTISGNHPTRYTDGPGGHVSAISWTGNFADEPCVEAVNNITCSQGASNPYVYNDTYAQWVLRGIAGNNSATYSGFSAWTGIGGLTNSPEYNAPYALVQSGSQDESYGWCGSQTCNQYTVWVENLTGAHEDPPIFPWGQSATGYNATVYSENWTNSNGANATSEVGIYNTNDWYTTNSFQNGANYGANVETAEAILEVQTPYDQPRFSSYEFDAISVFDKNSGYSRGMDNTWHDYIQTVGSSGYNLDSIGSLVTNYNYSPPVTNTITWQLYT